MGWLHPMEAYNKKADENRRDRTAQALAAVIAGGADESSFSFFIDRELVLTCHVKDMAERVGIKLAALGVENWQFDLEASQAAGQTNEGYGYGNFRPTWHRLTLVFSRQEPAMAEIHTLQPRPALSSLRHVQETHRLAA